MGITDEEGSTHSLLTWVWLIPTMNRGVSNRVLFRSFQSNSSRRSHDIARLSNSRPSLGHDIGICLQAHTQPRAPLSWSRTAESYLVKSLWMMTLIRGSFAASAIGTGLRLNTEIFVTSFILIMASNTPDPTKPWKSISGHISERE